MGRLAFIAHKRCLQKLGACERHPVGTGNALKCGEVSELSSTEISMDGEQQARLKAEILAYIAENPNAADTAGGIAGWWLPRVVPSVRAERLENILAELVRGGEIERVELACDTVIYGRARNEHRG